MSKSVKLGWLLTVVTMMCGTVMAADPSADPCSLLSASAVSTAMKGTYAAPTKTVAPRPFKDNPEGTDCHYRGDHTELLFRIYVDPSPDVAKATFAKLSAWYPYTSTPSIGDQAYFDKDHAIHVLKGKVRFFISGGRDAKAEAGIQQLATQVAGQL